MSGGTLRAKLDGFLGQSGDSSGGGGSLRDRLNAFRQPEVGVTLEGLDTEAEARGDKIPEWKDERSNWDKPWDEALDSVAPGVLDTMRGAAKGLLSGVGDNRDTVAVRQSAARSPGKFGAAKFAGEVLPAAVALPQEALGGFATGLVSGAASGYGNAEGTTEERLAQALPAAAIGAVGGQAAEYLAPAAGKLSSLLGKKSDWWAEKQATRGLMNSGAQPGDLERLDQLGGRRGFYDDSKRLGIRGKPDVAAQAAQRVVDEQEAARAAIEARHAGIQIDPKAAAAAVRSSNPYPGVTRMDRAADRAANQVEQAGPSLGAQDIQRKYYGNSANFASGSPNQALGQGVHGAVNGEIEDAMNLAKPGDGSAWRQAGRDERTGLEIGKFAKKAADTADAAPITLPDAASLGAVPLLNSNRHAVMEGVYGAGKNLAGAGSAATAAVGRDALGTVGGATAGVMAGNRDKPPDLAQAALDVLYTKGPELGRYNYEFSQAAGSPNPSAVKDLVMRLTMSDADFRDNVAPLLRKRAMAGR
jgi:hypothetical protein